MHNRIMNHSLLKGVHLCVQDCTHTYIHVCACACVCTLCNTEVIIHAVTCHVDVSSDGETVCSLLAIASLGMFLRNREYDRSNKRNNYYTSVQMCILTTVFMHVVLAYLMSLLRNGCCNMAAINITHFTTLRLNLKSCVAHATPYFTCY